MSIFKECPVCGAHLDPGETCNCREPKLVTYADWEAAGSFEKAARPGDAVEERIVDEFLNCLPPVRAVYKRQLQALRNIIDGPDHPAGQ